MFEETGIVVAIEGNFAWLETQPVSACGHCNVGDSCGTSVLGKWFSRKANHKRNRVRVLNEIDLQVGESAVVGVSDNALIKAAFIAYMLPLLSMISFSILGSILGIDNAGVAICSVVGLLSGFWLISLINKLTGKAAYQVHLLRKLLSENDTARKDVLLQVNIQERGKEL